MVVLPCILIRLRILGDVIVKVVDALKLFGYGIAILAVDLAMVSAQRRWEDLRQRQERGY